MTSRDIFGVYPFQVGSRSAWVLHDGIILGEPVQQYAIDVSDEQISALFAPHFLDPRRIQLGVSPILFHWGTELVLTDTGVGSVAGDPIGSLAQRLNDLGIAPEEINVILLTHLHIDHVGGALDRTRKQSLFPRARIFIPKEEIEFWQTPNPDISELRNVPPELVELTIRCALDALEILKNQIQSFSPDQELLEGIRSVALPGHTPGQSGYLFGSEESQFLVMGDAMHDPLLHVQRPEWTSMGDARRKLTVQTRRNLLARLANERLRFQGYHFPFPGIGHIRSNGPDKFEFVPERWTWG
jgi:glyoxylase-like metal-dependent hydrolase (beta-lactamase superfamily II)